MSIVYAKDLPRRVHYRPYGDEPAACGLWDPNYETDSQNDVTCEDCKYELR